MTQLVVVIMEIESTVNDSLRDAISLAAQSAALAPRREVPSLIPRTRSHPSDIYLPHWKRPSTLHPWTVMGASTTPCQALSMGEERRMATHGEECHNIGAAFIPLVIESLGSWRKMNSWDYQETWTYTRAEGGYAHFQLYHPPFAEAYHLPLYWQCHYVNLPVCLSDHPI